MLSCVVTQATSLLLKDNTLIVVSCVNNTTPVCIFYFTLSDNLLHEGGCNYHFYLAVDRYQFKMETLMDLLGVAGRRPGFPMVVCCSSHDELDAASSAVANVPCISLASLLMVSKVIIFEAYDNLFGSRFFLPTCTALLDRRKYTVGFFLHLKHR
ncbi:hypothetical protein TB2_039678 [Malus domestica]